MSIYDVAPTILNLFGMDRPENIAGKSLTAAQKDVSKKRKGVLKNWLKKIGNWL
jgi:arylsulfatase A-like enzyme